MDDVDDVIVVELDDDDDDDEMLDVDLLERLVLEYDDSDRGD